MNQCSAVQETVSSPRQEKMAQQQQPPATVWLFEVEPDKWAPFAPEDSQLIENEYAKGQQQVTVSLRYTTNRQETGSALSSQSSPAELWTVAASGTCKGWHLAVPHPSLFTECAGFCATKADATRA